ncbi:MAG: hypothetical protein ABJE95_15755 [Byssovorax sp.]
MKMSIRTLSLAAVLAAAAVTGTHAAQAQSPCNSGTKVLTAIWGKWGEGIKSNKCKANGGCEENLAKKEALIKDMITFWNEQAQGSWATIGPRQLAIDSGINDGKVIAGLARLWVTHTGLDHDNYDIVVTKQGGTSAKVTASKFDGTTCLTDSVVSFDKDDKVGTQKVLHLRRAKGQLASVYVDAGGLGAFDYKFTMTRVLLPSN